MDRWLHRGTVWAEWTFRGQDLGLYKFSNDLNRPDWHLVHRHDEKSLVAKKSAMDTIDLPDSFPLPPLQVSTLAV